MSKVLLRVVGFSLLVLAWLGLGMTIIRAISHGQSFYGVNYKDLPLGTWSGLIAYIVGTIGGAIGIGKYLISAFRSRRVK